MHDWFLRTPVDAFYLYMVHWHAFLLTHEKLQMDCKLYKRFAVDIGIFNALFAECHHIER